jgi:alpha-L-fucosidase 2
MLHKFNKYSFWLMAVLLVGSCSKFRNEHGFTPFAHDLHFDSLATRWDEAIPLGNGMLGALIWEKEGKLRFSLDRADLWDLRPMENLNSPEWRFKWVLEQWRENTYHRVQEKFDAPYDRNPAPSKIPAAALEFGTDVLGGVEYAHLYIKQGLCEVKWKNGARLQTTVNTTEPVGWFRFDELDENVAIELIAPAYNLEGTNEEKNPVVGQDLRRLGYPRGELRRASNSIVYTQKGWDGFEYQVLVKWEKTARGLLGCWSIASSFPGYENGTTANGLVGPITLNRYDEMLKSHVRWWSEFWAKSAITIPDKPLERQWYLEMYKLGACARKGAPPISLQAIWTADNGSLPPWKGDFHHDLNTQLSYWPAYSSNHTDLAEGFTDWLWKYRDTFRAYTKTYFETDGLNVPGVSTLAGQPMGGWIQYAFGPTVSAWLAQHFYLQWAYTGDTVFLRERAYPWFRDVATYLGQISVKDPRGYRRLPISSSPEINDNSREAWFAETTNFDLALIKFAFTKASEMASSLGMNSEADHWKSLLAEWPDYATDPNEGLMFARDYPYHASHRHFSHLMAIHPLGLIDWSNGESDRQVIRNTIATLDRHGSDWWTGYSFSWLANLKARALDGEGAARALQIFAEGFCLPNSFHVNGDQSGKGHSKFTYRPFTLEGNFAFAAGLQEMLIQSHTGIIRVFPAIPAAWANASFSNLRAQGAFLVSANRVNGKLSEVIVKSEKGGTVRVHNSFASGKYLLKGNVSDSPIIEIDMEPGETVRVVAN